MISRASTSPGIEVPSRLHNEQRQANLDLLSGVGAQCRHVPVRIPCLWFARSWHWQRNDQRHPAPRIQHAIHLVADLLGSVKFSAHAQV